MSKKIGIIYSDMHPLIEHVAAHIERQGHCAELVHYRALAFGATLGNPLQGYDSIYLDRLGETTLGYTTQISLLNFMQQLSRSTQIKNTPDSYLLARNKALSGQHLKLHGICQPATDVVYNIAQSE